MKKTLSAITFALAFVLLSAFDAKANFINSPELTGDCEKFSISVLGATYQDCSLIYNLTLTPTDATQAPITVTGSVLLPNTYYGFSERPRFVFTSNWSAALSGSYTVTGTVTMSCSNGDSETLQLNEITISDCNPPTGWCPRTPGYWKNHPGDWPVTSLILGGEEILQTELLEMLSAPARGDMDVILTKHLIAAMLNSASGSSLSVEAADAISDANEYLSGNANIDAEDTKDILDDFNNSGDCD